jgi:hypothetical protein
VCIGSVLCLHNLRFKCQKMTDLQDWPSGIICTDYLIGGFFCNYYMRRLRRQFIYFFAGLSQTGMSGTCFEFLQTLNRSLIQSNPKSENISPPLIPIYQTIFSKKKYRRFLLLCHPQYPFYKSLPFPRLTHLRFLWLDDHMYFWHQWILLRLLGL